MPVVSALAAIATLAFQGGMTSLAGRVVPINYPTGSVVQVPEEVKKWDGFIGVNGTSTDWPSPFAGPGDWSPITQRLSELGAVAAGSPEWKTKVIILTQTDGLQKGVDGIYRQDRIRLDSKQVDAILRSLVRVPGYARAATDGNLNVKLEVSIDNDPMVFPSNVGLGDWLREYLAARVNKGTFEADDKVFRGPYQSVIVIGAGSASSTSTTGLWVPDASYISASKYWSGYGECEGLENQVALQIASQAWQRWLAYNIYLPSVNQTGSGMAGEFHPLLPNLFRKEIWALLQSNVEPNLDGIATMYQLANTVNEPLERFLELPSRSAPIAEGTQVSVATDVVRGSVLRYGERALARLGGFALPYRDIDVTKTPMLSFWAKTSSKDRLSIFIDDKMSKGGPPRHQVLDIPADGEWHELVIDLKRLPDGPISQIYIAPADPGHEADQIGEVVFFFDDFQLSADKKTTQTDKLGPTALDERALAAKTQTALELAKEGSDLVKLNGLLDRGAQFVAADEPGLIELSKSVNPRIASLALSQLAKLGTATAKAEVLRLVNSSPLEGTKQAAMIEAGRLGDPVFAGALSRQFASNSWHTRLAAAKALTMLPGDEAAVISMTFLQEIDPQVRWTVTSGANTENNVVVKRMLWSAVNDPSDAVRAMSCWKLIESGKPKDAGEGYKGVRDDSVGVRLELVERMGASPSPRHRDALLVAVADSSWRVRAAALRSLAKQAEAVKVEEIANVLEDKYPAVQFALLDLAKAKALSLPPTAIANLKASLDARVVERAKELGL